jgi:citronellol/citronellal dehydrogenase
VLPIVGDIRDEARVASAVAQTVERFGGIDLCINNASALNLADVAAMPIKRYDLLQSINARGTFIVTQACLPLLRQSEHAHILTLSPPLNLDPSWFRSAAYTASKYAMTIFTLGVAETERDHGIGANCLWPVTAIATAAVRNLMGGEKSIAHCRTPRIVADAATAILRRSPTHFTGNAVLDEDVLAEEGITDLASYSAKPGQTSFFPDFFVDPARVGV